MSRTGKFASKANMIIDTYLMNQINKNRRKGKTSKHGKIKIN